MKSAECLLIVCSKRTTSGSEGSSWNHTRDTSRIRVWSRRRHSIVYSQIFLREMQEFPFLNKSQTKGNSLKSLKINKTITTFLRMINSIWCFLRRQLNRFWEYAVSWGNQEVMPCLLVLVEVVSNPYRNWHHTLWNVGHSRSKLTKSTTRSHSAMTLRKFVVLLAATDNPYHLSLLTYKLRTNHSFKISITFWTQVKSQIFLWRRMRLKRFTTSWDHMPSRTKFKIAQSLYGITLLTIFEKTSILFCACRQSDRPWESGAGSSHRWSTAAI